VAVTASRGKVSLARGTRVTARLGGCSVVPLYQGAHDRVHLDTKSVSPASSHATLSALEQAKPFFNTTYLETR
jgi:hypothetical protein